MAKNKWKAGDYKGSGMSKAQFMKKGKSSMNQQGQIEVSQMGKDMYGKPKRVPNLKRLRRRGIITSLD